MQKVLAAIGLLFVVWLVWTWAVGEPVTGYIAHQRNDHLYVPDHITVDPKVPCPKWHPEVGTGWGKIEIPRLGVKAKIVQGTDEGVLSYGPGHYVETGTPCQDRSVGIAAHRTTWGAWFRDLDKLHSGDTITVTMPWERYTYRVTGSVTVLPKDVEVLGRADLVLTTCTPAYSASHRLVIYAEREG